MYAYHYYPLHLSPIVAQMQSIHSLIQLCLMLYSVLSSNCTCTPRIRRAFCWHTLYVYFICSRRKYEEQEMEIHARATLYLRKEYIR